MPVFSSITVSVRYVKSQSKHFLSNLPVCFELSSQNFPDTGDSKYPG